ncbi:MAG: prepilin-type N-terminal cleavage/methylation domain-containing protein [Planctomycetaceae bacterium]
MPIRLTGGSRPYGVTCLSHARWSPVLPERSQPSTSLDNEAVCVGDGTFLPASAWLSNSGQRWAAGRRRAACHGFTLLEVILVLTILLVLASLTWPPLLRYIRERSIREQAHTIRVELNNARIKAIDQGLTYQFRFEPGGRKFVVLPYDRPDTGSGGSTSTSSSTVTTPTLTVSVPVLSGTIAEPCEFDVPQVRNAVTHADQAVVTEKLPDEWLTMLPDANLLRETSWAPAIRFYSDGTADDATVAVIDDSERRIEISLRGLTGSVQSGPLVRERRL